VVAALSANYVPAKLNVDYYRGTAGQYGVSSLPTTIILAPGRQQEVLEVIRGRIPAAEFAARLNLVAANTRPHAQTLTANIAAPGAPPPGPPAGPIAPPAGPLNPNPPVSSNPPAASPPPLVPAAQVAMASPVAAAPSPPPAGNAAPEHPPFGLDGYSPILLVEKKIWVQGDPRWGAIHRNRTYLFASQEEQRRFLENDNADRYAPVNSGDDVVLRVEQGRAVPGMRQHGVDYGGHIYLFADEMSLAKFSKNPRYYADRATEAMRAGSWK
jgi:YHS domain-containing protein